MKIIALGDTHGKDIWKEIVKKESDADKVIFIGDYFDSFTISYTEQKQNFKDILEYKIKNPDKVVLLFGNHDFHYVFKERYSGFQSINEKELQDLFETALKSDFIQMVFRYNKFLFTHAGVTKTWFTSKIGAIQDNMVADEINLLFRLSLDPFKFTPGKNYSNFGDDITQSPIWVRPLSLFKDKLDNFIQVVGHTHQKKINLEKEVFFIDAFDSRNEYLIIKDNKPKIGRI